MFAVSKSSLGALDVNRSSRRSPPNLVGSRRRTDERAWRRRPESTNRRDLLALRTLAPSGIDGDDQFLRVIAFCPRIGEGHNKAGAEGRRTLGSGPSVFQTSQLAAVWLNDEKEAAPAGEPIRLRFRIGVLDAEVGRRHWGHRPMGYFEIAPNSIPAKWRDPMRGAAPP